MANPLLATAKPRSKTEPVREQKRLMQEIDAITKRTPKSPPPDPPRDMGKLLRDKKRMLAEIDSILGKRKRTIAEGGN